MKKYKHVIFDMDGTLLNTSEGIKKAVRYTLAKLQLEDIKDYELDFYIGPPIQYLFEKKYKFTKNDAQKAADIFREYYKNYSLFIAEPYQNVYQVLSALKKRGKTLSIATYKREDYALKLFERFNLNLYCQSLHGGDNINKKTKADIIMSCILETKNNIGDCIYVGDTFGDQSAAETLGVDFIGVTYGFGFRKEDEIKGKGTIYTIEKVEELLDIIM